MSDIAPRPGETSQPRWQPVSSLDRRVLGVLVEKAKTTPDQYPLSLSALRSGCNQKNNRTPLIEVEVEDIEESLERLRALGAVTEVQGGGRVSRFRHAMYEWLGVDKVELAVMAELLLRGTQTEGELRGRAARMEPIADLGALRPVLASLKSKGLVIALSPEGRGHVVTHALYEPREMDKVRAEAAQHVVDSPPRASESVAPVVHSTAPAAQPQGAALASQESVNQLRRELEETRAELAGIRKDLDELWSNFR